MNRIPLNEQQVHAFLSGATELRIPVRPQPERINIQGYWQWWLPTRELQLPTAHCESDLRGQLLTHCPYPTGSLVALTERWRPVKWQTGTGMYGDSVCGVIEFAANEHDLLKTKTVYRCGSVPYGFSDYWWGHGRNRGPWRPAITMPAEFSRFPRRVARNGVGRLQDITYDQIVASGWDARSSKPITGGTAGEDARAWYMTMWNARYPEFPWDSNAWVYTLGLEEV